MLAGALVLTGCTAADEGADPAPATAAGPTASGSTGAAAVDPDGPSAFEQQLPLQGDFVSQYTETVGSVRIERRSDGTTWAVLTGFSTGDVADPRLSLQEGPLEQDASGAWVDTAGMSFDIGGVEPALPDQEIAIPGAHLMPEIATLTVMDYAGADYPSLGSVAQTG